MYKLEIFRNKEKVNEVEVNEKEVLRQYFNAKELKTAKVNTLNYWSNGTIEKMEIVFPMGEYVFTQIKGA